MPRRTAAHIARGQRRVGAAVPWHAQPIAQFGGLPAAIAVDQARQIAWLGLGPASSPSTSPTGRPPLVIGRSEWLDDFISTLTVDGAVALALAGWPTDADPRVTLYTLDLAMPSAPRVLGADARARCARQQSRTAMRIVRERPRRPIRFASTAPTSSRWTSATRRNRALLTTTSSPAG
ncbi:MAG: hypothetical protein U0470_11245 [Anaerolineae bacterium]